MSDTPIQDLDFAELVEQARDGAEVDPACLIAMIDAWDKAKRRKGVKV